MNNSEAKLQGHGTAVAEQASKGFPAPKWAALVEDRSIPMPRQEIAARDILDQAGIGPDFILVRDHNSPHDEPFENEALVNLAAGNVFRTAGVRDPRPCRRAAATPKLAFVVDDAWEITVQPKQTGHSLKRLMGLPDDVELLRDFESPVDRLIADDDPVLFSDGPVFITRRLCLTVTVNNQPVHFAKRRVTGREIKETAIAQGVKIDLGCVLYRTKPDGGLGPAIRDDQHVTLKQGDAFVCVAPDDNS